MGKINLNDYKPNYSKNELNSQERLSYFCKKEQKKIAKANERYKYFRDKGFKYNSLVDIIYRCFQCLLLSGVLLLISIGVNIFYAFICH